MRRARRQGSQGPGGDLEQFRKQQDSEFRGGPGGRSLYKGPVAGPRGGSERWDRSVVLTRTWARYWTLFTVLGQENPPETGLSMRLCETVSSSKTGS